MKETMKDKIAKLDPSLINELSIIAQRTKAIEDKYNCRTVKFMFGLAKFLEAPRYIAPKLAQKIRDYAVNKINAPVCSIISTGTVKLPAMPIIALTDAEQKRINSMAKFSSISDKLFK